MLDIDGPDELDGEDVEFNQCTVTITQPMHYELTEEFVRTILRRGGFSGIRDGREATHGPVEIASVFLRDPPPAPRPRAGASLRLQEAFELPDFQPIAAVATAGRPVVGSGHWGPFAASSATFNTALSLAAAAAAALAIAGAAAVCRRDRQFLERYVAIAPAGADAPLQRLPQRPPSHMRAPR